jgi:hypothetical protein
MLGYAKQPQDEHGRGARDTGNSAIPLILLAAAVVAVLAYVATVTTRDAAEPARPPYHLMADYLDVFQTSADFAAGKADRVTTAANRLVLSDERPQFPRLGTWTSPEVTTPRPFTELLPSYNPDCPPDTGLRFDVRTRDARTGQWSPWFFLGDWGRTIGKQERVTKNDVGHVAIDILYLNGPADAYQVRTRFYAFNLDDKTNPALRRLTVCTSGVEPDAAKRDSLVRPVSLQSSIARDLPVPFRAQGVESKPLRPEICSPTSVSMVLQYLGHDRPTAENALAIYDDHYDLFGNWARAVAWAGQQGFDAHLTRFRTFDQARATIAAGQPIIASIRFKAGEAPSFVMKETAGHLIVIRGSTPTGDFIVNDPASKERGNGAVYKADDLARAWLAHGGVGYIIRKPQ